MVNYFFSFMYWQQELVFLTLPWAINFGFQLLIDRSFRSVVTEITETIK